MNGIGSSVRIASLLCLRSSGMADLVWVTGWGSFARNAAVLCRPFGIILHICSSAFSPRSGIFHIASIESGFFLGSATESDVHTQSYNPAMPNQALQRMLRIAELGVVRLLAIIVMKSYVQLWVAAIAFFAVILFLDYLHTRSAANLALLVTRLGPGTPIEVHESELGKPVKHLTAPEVMEAWGPSKDRDLIARTELFYFSYKGLPFRHIIVYADKSTRKAVYVSWKSD